MEVLRHIILKYFLIFYMVISVLAIIFSIAIIKAIGILRDKRSENHSLQLYAHFPNGIIQNGASRQLISGNDTAIIFIHGFTDSAEIFDSITTQLHGVDWFIPLLPFHGRRLEEMLDFDTYIVERFISDFIEQRSSYYKRLIVVGQSMGGTILIRLARKNHWSSLKYHLILMSPAVFLYTNNWIYRFLFQVYPWFRNYFPTPNLNITSQSLINNFQPTCVWTHHVIPSLPSLHAYCRDAEAELKQLNIPYSVFIAQDDNRVNNFLLVQNCQDTSSSRLFVFEHGTHLLYWSQHVPQITDHLQKLISSGG